MIHFGTGGFRAVIGEDFTRANVEKIAYALVETIREDGATHLPVVIGYDRRFLSDLAAQWLSEVFAAYGLQVLLIGQQAPTPMIMFVVKNEGAYLGVAVTASHNPAEYNGIKLFTAGGRDASAEMTQALERRMEALGDAPIARLPFAQALEQGLVRRIHPENDYIDSILSVLNVEAIKQRRLRVLLDPMFGVGKTSLQTVLLTCRCDVDVINDRHDTLFGGKLPSPSAQTLGRLSTLVVEGGYDLGIGTDGDADRVGLIDATGRFIHPNDIMVLIYYYLCTYKQWQGDVVRSVATTHMLDAMARDLGRQCHEVPVGFKYISAKMLETDALVGGESSGGLTVRGHINGKDGIYAAALIVEMLCVMKQPLSEILEMLHKRYGRREMSEYDCRFTQQTKDRLSELLFVQKQLPTFPIEIDRVSYVDGCKIYFKNDGWIICRFSGTEPLLRIFCEMQDRSQARYITHIMTDFLGLEPPQGA